MRARPINPGANQALSGNARAANATQTQDDILHSLNGAADDGLTQLRTGVGTLVDGLTQLHDGSQQLSDGLATAAAGSQKLADGMHSADGGGRQLANGFNSPTGAPDLTSGSTALAAGLVLIDAGLAQLADPATGLPKAQAGSAALSVGVSTILAGLGTYSTSPVPNPPTILYGLKKSRDGLTAIEAGITTQILPGLIAEKAGVLCVKHVILNVADGAAAGADACYTGGVRPPLPGLCTLCLTPSPVSFAVLHGVASKIGSTGDTTNATLVGGLNLITGGVSNPLCNPANPTDPLNPCGVVQGLDAVNTGPASGLGKVTGGLLLVKGGLSNPACNPANPTDPLNPCGVLEGLTALNAGLTTAVNGVNQLHAGSTSAAAGANTLKGGIGTAGAGAATLAAGLDLLAAGADQLNAGVPTAVAGSNKITAGLGSAQSGAGQLQAGLADLQTKAVGPLGSQLLEGSSNARLELATIDATGDRAATAPMGADATWLYRLDAVIPVEDSQTGRNLALGGAGLVLLLLGGGGGFLLGRRGRVTP